MNQYYEALPARQAIESSHTWNYCEQQKFMYGPTPPRLTAFCNGCVSFPYSERYAIMEHIAEDIESKQPMMWNQIAYEKDGCRLAIDIDSDGRVLSEKEIRTLATILKHTLDNCYRAPDPIPIFGASCGPRLKKGKLSTGLHFVCHVQVTIMQAQQITAAYERQLHEEHFPMDNLEVDSAIYRCRSKSVSLRMIYSHKIEKCPMCCDTDLFASVLCHLCLGHGKVLSKFTYVPILSVDAKTSENRDIQNHSLWAEVEDIRPDYIEPDMDTKESAKTPKARKKSEVTRVVTSSYGAITNAIRNISVHGKQLWDNVVVSKVVCNPKNTQARIQVQGPSACNCPYAGKQHGSNRVWFSLQRRTGQLTVHCYSQKQRYRCRHKKRIRFTLSKMSYKTLF
jgi:hypothetical protein